MKQILLIQTGHASVLSQDIVKKHGDYDTWFLKALNLSSSSNIKLKVIRL